MDTQKLKNSVSSIETTIEKLLETSKTKQTVLIERNHEQLNSLIEKEQQLLNTIANLSKQQKIFSDEIKNEFGLPKEMNSLTDILDLIKNKLNENDFVHLKTSLKKINDQSAELNRFNEQNKMLIEASRIFIKGIIQSVRGSANSSIINRRM